MPSTIVIHTPTANFRIRAKKTLKILIRSTLKGLSKVLNTETV